MNYSIVAPTPSSPAVTTPFQSPEEAARIAARQRYFKYNASASAKTQIKAQSQKLRTALEGARGRYSIPAHADIARCVEGGLILDNIVFWHQSNEEGDARLRVYRDGKWWLACGQVDWWGICFVSPKQVKESLARLQRLGVIEVDRFDFRGRTIQHIHLNVDRYLELLEHAVKNPNVDGTFSPREGSAKAAYNRELKKLATEQNGVDQPSFLGGSYTIETSPKTSRKQQTTARENFHAPATPEPAVVVSLSDEPTATAASTCSEPNPSKSTGLESNPSKKPDSSLLVRLTAIGVAAKVAADLVQTEPHGVIAEQIEALPDRNPKNPGALLSKCIRENLPLPPAFITRKEAEKRAANQRDESIAERAATARQKATEAAKMAQADLTGEELDGQLTTLSPDKREAIERQAVQRLGVLGRAGQNTGAMVAMRRNLLRELNAGALGDTFGLLVPGPNELRQ